jgi:hypothetical protein
VRVLALKGGYEREAYGVGGGEGEGGGGVEIFYCCLWGLLVGGDGVG